LKSYDLVVIGAGIYGCWSALHASSRGLNVALIDRGDIAGATSSCSTKLLHGGLRYLEQFEFSLVKKSLAERKQLKKMLPHLVRPTSFWIPIKEGKPTSPWKMSIGLWLYEHLAKSRGVVPPSRRRKIDDLLEAFPTLNFGQLDGAFSYGDIITDDHRMALIVALSATDHGCDLYTYHEASMPSDDIMRLTPTEGDPFEIKGEKFLHCTGQALKNHPQLNAKLRLTQGTHLVLPDLGQKDALLLNSPLDQRKFFLVPWYGRTLLGTTDLPIKAEDTPKVSAHEVTYLLDSLKKTVGFDIKPKDILGSFVGVRVLRGGDGLNPSDVSRDWAFQPIANNEWASLGGKYTSARVDSLEMIDQLFPNTQAIDLRLRDSESSLPIDHLHGRYGASTQKIHELISGEPGLSEKIFPDLNFIWAEVLYSLREEKVTHLVDLLRRRLPLTLLHPWDSKTARRAQEMAATELQWNEARSSEEFDLLKLHWQKSLSFS
jgi:glycerol-3-phosphate dehydrogenase